MAEKPGAYSTPQAHPLYIIIRTNVLNIKIEFYKLHIQYNDHGHAGPSITTESIKGIRIE